MASNGQTILAGDPVPQDPSPPTSDALQWLLQKIRSREKPVHFHILQMEYKQCSGKELPADLLDELRNFEDISISQISNNWFVVGRIVTKAAFEEWDYRHSQHMRSSKVTKRKGVKFSEAVDEKYFEPDRENFSEVLRCDDEEKPAPLVPMPSKIDWLLHTIFDLPPINAKQLGPPWRIFFANITSVLDFDFCLAQNKPIVQGLVLQMNQFYQNLLGNAELKGNIPCPNLMIGGLYAVQSHGFWSRVVILSLEDSKANVRFIDRGGTETFKVLKLLPLPGHFCDLPPMILAGKLDGFVDEDEELDDLTNEFEQIIEFGSNWGKEFIATTDVADFDDDDFWVLNVFNEGADNGSGCSINHVLLKWVLERQKRGNKFNAEKNGNGAEIRSHLKHSANSVTPPPAKKIFSSSANPTAHTHANPIAHQPAKTNAPPPIPSTISPPIPPTISPPISPPAIPRAPIRPGLFGVLDLFEFLPHEKTLIVSMTRLSRDPADFALQLQSWQGKSLESFQRQMKEVYEKSQPIDAEAVLPGKAYACRRGNSEWTRCYVIEIMASDSFYVFLFDSGEFDIIPVKEIRQLTEQFASIPAMALRGILRNVKPVPPIVSWDDPACRSACVEFLKLTQGKPLVATQCGPAQKWHSSVIPIWLPLISVQLSHKNVDIGGELCRAGLAVQAEQQE